MTAEQLRYQRPPAYVHQLLEQVETQKETIRELVELVDYLRGQFNNTPRHDIYLQATERMNALADAGRIP